jgi:uncharacterized SAM-binding protein YcdF (DUF218 family)
MYAGTEAKVDKVMERQEGNILFWSHLCNTSSTFFHVFYFFFIFLLLLLILLLLLLLLILRHHHLFLLLPLDPCLVACIQLTIIFKPQLHLQFSTLNTDSLIRLFYSPFNPRTTTQKIEVPFRSVFPH